MSQESLRSSSKGTELGKTEEKDGNNNSSRILLPCKYSIKHDDTTIGCREFLSNDEIDKHYSENKEKHLNEAWTCIKHLVSEQKYLKLFMKELRESVYCLVSRISTLESSNLSEEESYPSIDQFLGNFEEEYGSNLKIFDGNQDLTIRNKKKIESDEGVTCDDTSEDENLRNSWNDNDVCGFCRRKANCSIEKADKKFDWEPDFMGPFKYKYQKQSFSEFVHFSCALWSPQVWCDSNGMLVNVPKELKRGKTLKCKVCKRSGATLGCFDQKCKNTFHLTCLLEEGCVWQETPEFRVYCNHDGNLLSSKRSYEENEDNCQQKGIHLKRQKFENKKMIYSEDSETF